MERSGVEKKHFIFYFYLIRKLTGIKEEIEEIREKGRTGKKSRPIRLLEKTGIAAALTLVIYYAVVFVYLGKLIWPNRAAWIEMSFEFIFLLLLFSSHRFIAQFFRKNTLNRSLSLWKAAAEMITVITTAIILHYLVNYLPVSIIYSEAEFDPVRVRNGYVIGIFIALFFYYFVEMRKREKQLQAEKLRSARLQKENFQAQLESLKQQVNPHFLFNSLNVLGSLVYSDQDKAVDFIRKLSDLYRSFLDHGAETLISLKKEIEVCQAYTYLLKTRFGNAVEFSFNIPTEKLAYLLPPGSVQMLIENAVKHNGSTPSKPLRVEILTENDSLVIRNGLNPRKEKIFSTRTGLENIKNRYRYLTDEQVEIQKNENQFEVKLPLLKTEDYENSDN